MKEEIAIIGGGAAGFYCAVHLAERLPQVGITIYEAQNKLMSKILISGGGRCNVTNAETDPVRLATNYPRGHDVLAPVFARYGPADVRAWFEREGVALHVEEDGRVFPRSNDSRTIYRCLHDLAIQRKVRIRPSHKLSALRPSGTGWELEFQQERVKADKVVLCSGSSKGVWKLLAELGHRIVEPVPSLFTFQCERNGLEALSGISVPNARLHLGAATSNGPLLITHVGLSGPATLKLSAWEARTLASLNYRTDIHIQWNSEWTEEGLTEQMRALMDAFPKERILNWQFHGLPKRLWAHLLQIAALPAHANGAELGRKGMERIQEQLMRYPLKMIAKSTFKEEFVTAGGVDLEQIDLQRFESKLCPGLFMAGEVLNVDAVTGGYNFQAAWTGAYLISEAV